MTQIFNYETKCRICGTIHNQKMSVKEINRHYGFHHNWFRKAILREVANSSQYKCYKCKKGTIQDIVSYQTKP